MPILCCGIAVCFRNDRGFVAVAKSSRTHEYFVAPSTTVVAVAACASHQRTNPIDPIDDPTDPTTTIE
jgi:hypothetical protein